MTLLVASEIPSGFAEQTASTTIMAAASPTSPRQRTPIGLPCRSRLRPSAPPASAAAPRRITISHQSSKTVPLKRLLRQTPHHVKFVVWPHAGDIGHPIGQREEGSDCGDVPDIIVAKP